MYAFVAAAIAASQTLAPVPAASASTQASTTAPLEDTVIPTAARAACCTLAKLTPVLLTIDEPVDSDKAQIGQSFALRLAEPLTIGDGLVIPAGTKGIGEVIHAAKSRAMGKPGELLLAARYLDWNGTRVPLRSFKFGKPQGQDNATTAAIVGIAVSALITPFITGGEVRIPAGADAWAKVGADVTVPKPAPAEAPVAAAGPTEPVNLGSNELQPGGKL